MQASEKRLRIVLKINGSFSFLSGLTLISFQDLVDILGVKQSQLLIYLGIGLLIFAFSVFHAAFRKQLNSRQVKSIIVQDLAWVLASMMVILFQVWALTPTGYSLIGIVATIILAFALLQRTYLKKVDGHQ